MFLFCGWRGLGTWLEEGLDFSQPYLWTGYISTATCSSLCCHSTPCLPVCSTCSQFLVWGFLGNILSTPVIPGLVLSVLFFLINSTIMVQFTYHNVHPILRILFRFFFYKFIAWYKSVQSSSRTCPSLHKVLWCPSVIRFPYQPQPQAIHRSAFCLYSFAFSGNLM